MDKRELLFVLRSASKWKALFLLIQFPSKETEYLLPGCSIIQRANSQDNFHGSQIRYLIYSKNLICNKQSKPLTTDFLKTVPDSISAWGIRH